MSQPLGAPAPASPPASEWSNRRIVFLAAMVALVVSAVWRAPEWLTVAAEKSREVFIAFVLATGFTYVLRPFVRAINRTKAFGAGSHSGRMGSAVVVMLICLLLLVLFFMVGLKPISNDLQQFWQASVPAGKEPLYDRVMIAVGNLVEPYRQSLPPGVEERVKALIPGLVTKATVWLQGLASHLGFVVELILVPVLVFYFLTDGPKIRAEVKLLVPAEWRPRMGRIANSLDWVLDGYIRGQVIMCLIAWIVVTGVLWALHVPHAFTMGLLAGLTRAVPVIGPLLGFFPIVLVCQLATGDLQKTLIVALGFSAMHFLESKVLLPKVVGHHVDLHPVSVIAAILLGMEFFGFLGVFMAVPVAALLKIVLAEWHDARLAARLQSEADTILSQNYQLNEGEAPCAPSA